MEDKNLYTIPYSKEGDNENNAPPEGLAAYVPFLDEELRICRRWRLIAAVAAIVFGAALFVLAIMHIELRRERAGLHAADQAGPPEWPRRLDDFDGGDMLFGLRSAGSASRYDIRMDLILDHIHVTDFSPPPLEVFAANVDWLKAAAYHLVNAEKSFEEGNLEAAMGSYHSLQAIAPGIRGVRGRVALIHMNRGDFEQARELLKQALEEEGPTFDLLNNLGAAYFSLGETARAADCFQSALELEPGYGFAHFNLAAAFLRQGKVDQAREPLARYMAAAPRDVAAFETYGRLLLELEDWKTAAEVLYNLVLKLPGRADIYFRLSLARLYAGDREGAVEAILDAAELLPDEKLLSWLSMDAYRPLWQDERIILLLDNIAE